MHGTNVKIIIMFFLTEALIFLEIAEDLFLAMVLASHLSSPLDTYRGGTLVKSMC